MNRLNYASDNWLKVILISKFVYTSNEDEEKTLEEIVEDSGLKITQKIFRKNLRIKGLQRNIINRSVEICKKHNIDYAVAYVKLITFL